MPLIRLKEKLLTRKYLTHLKMSWLKILSLKLGIA
jgi:hypothetical protein